MDRWEAGGAGRGGEDLFFLACESLHVRTVCIWRCAHARFCVGVFMRCEISIHSIGRVQTFAGRPRDVTLHAALQNQIVVCSGSRFTSSTVMILQGHDDRGGIKLELVQSPLAYPCIA